MIGAVAGVWLVYRQTMDPAGFWQSSQTAMMIGYGYLLPTAAGLLCFGVAMLRGGFPSWLGYGMVGTGVVCLVAVPLLRGEGGFFLSILIYLVTFVAGIVIWRQ